MNEEAAPSDAQQAGRTLPYSDLFMPRRATNAKPTVIETSQMILTALQNYMTLTREPEYHFTYPEMMQQRLDTAWVGTNTDVARQKLLHTVGESVSMRGTALYTDWVNVDRCLVHWRERGGKRAGREGVD